MENAGGEELKQKKALVEKLQKVAHFSKSTSFTIFLSSDLQLILWG